MSKGHPRIQIVTKAKVNKWILWGLTGDETGCLRTLWCIIDAGGCKRLADIFWLATSYHRARYTITASTCAAYACAQHHHPSPHQSTQNWGRTIQNIWMARPIIPQWLAPDKISCHNCSFIQNITKGPNNQVVHEDDIFTLHSLSEQQIWQTSKNLDDLYQTEWWTTFDIKRRAGVASI